MQQPVQQFTNKNQLHILARLGAQIFIESRKMLLKCETQLKQLLIYLKQFHLFSGRLKRHDVLLRHSAHFETWSLSRSVDVSHTQNETFDETSDRGMKKQLNSCVMDTRSHPLSMKLDSDGAGARFPALIEAIRSGGLASQQFNGLWVGSDRQMGTKKPVASETLDLNKKQKQATHPSVFLLLFVLSFITVQITFSY